MKSKNSKSKISVIGLAIGLVLGFVFEVLILFSNRLSWNVYDNPKDTVNYTHNNMLENYKADAVTSSYNNANTTMADKLFNEVRVLCWILTNPQNHALKAIHIKRTWGKRCNKLIFMSSVEDRELGAVALPVNEGRDNLWAKTKEAFKYVYKHHFDDYDWFLKADDDSYMIMENLRYMLYEYDPEYPIYFGCRFNQIQEEGTIGGGSGYVLSKETLKRFVEDAIPDPDKCRQDNEGAEDAEIVVCLLNVKAFPADTRDKFKRHRFHPITLVGHILRIQPDWFWNIIYYKVQKGFDCCSDESISFHYMTPKEFYILDYFVYNFRPFGLVYGYDDLPKKRSLKEIMRDLYIADKVDKKFKGLAKPY